MSTAFAFPGSADRVRVRAPASGLIGLEDRAPWRGLDKTSFSFRHKLAGHPLFELPRLAALSQKVFNRVDFDRYFPAEDLRLGEAELKRRLHADVLGIGSTKRWLALHFVNELDPEYEALFQQLLADIEVLADAPIRDRMTWGSMTVFMNSPGLAVPYHFDHETNFLLQIRGEKDVRLYPADRTVLTEEEIEDFYRHNPVAGRYRPELANMGTSYRLTPGIGVHHPPLAPHLIKNGDEISISLSMYYTLPETDFRAHVYQANFFLRKLGLHPKPPGQSRFVDEAKNRFMQALSMSHPRTHDERLYSGVARLGMPLRLMKKVVPHRTGARAPS
jgi:hypothetical protein